MIQGQKHFYSVRIIFQLDDLELEEGEITDTDDVSEQDIMDDNEREKLIREGQMTPFGTISTASKTVSFPRPAKPYTKEPVSVRKKVASKDAAKAEMISRGEMTPFGTIIRPSDSDRFVCVCSLYVLPLLSLVFTQYFFKLCRVHCHHAKYLIAVRKRKWCWGEKGEV